MPTGGQGDRDSSRSKEGGESNHIIDEYGYSRTKEDLSGDKLGRGIESITRQRQWWKAGFPGGFIDPHLALKWRRRAAPKAEPKGSQTGGDAPSSLRASTGGMAPSSPRTPPLTAHRFDTPGCSRRTRTSSWRKRLTR